MIPSDKTAFQIGDWRIEPALDEISRDRETVKLEPRTMRVLVCLAQHAGEVVSVGQLLDTVWKDVVVTHDSVYQAVAGLRHALGDEPKEPAYIANVPRRGYRLIASVAPAEPGQVSSTPHNDSSAHGDAQGAQTPATQGAHEAAAVLPATRPILTWAGGTLMAIALLGALLWSIRWREPRPAFKAAPAGHPTAQRATIPAAAFAPPQHSVAVLPLVNIGGDKAQDYLSDGLTDELLNSLARINELQVTGRTSAFYFKGEHADLTTIARKLNVAAILEGSVRRSEHTVRVSVQLINTITGFGLWSATYDRDLGDVLKVQTEIADAVTGALKITLLGGAADKVQLGGTRNPAAFDAYLRGLRLARITFALMEDCRAPIDAFSEAIERDPNYALAYARRAVVRWDCASYSTGWLQQAGIANSVRVDAERATELAPGLPEGYVAMSNLEQGLLNLLAADQTCTRALALAPSNDQVLKYCSGLAVWFGRGDAGITLARRGVAVDPLNALSYRALGDALQYSRHYSEATAAYQNSIALDPEHADHAYWQRGRSYYSAGNLPEARASCEVKPDYWYSLVCKAIVYQKLGRREAASAAMRRAFELAGDAGGYQYAEIRAQWGERKAALEWLEKAMRARDPGLIYLRTDPLVDPLRNEPRFQAIERELKFPN